MLESKIGKCYNAQTPAPEAYICARLEDQIAYYEKKSLQNKRIYYIVSIVSIVANALIPIISIFLTSNTLPKVLITCLSSCTAILSSILVLFNAKDLWTKYRISASRLTALLHQYYSHSGRFAELEERQAFLLLVQLSESQMENEIKGWEGMFDHDAPPSQKP